MSVRRVVAALAIVGAAGFGSVGAAGAADNGVTDTELVVGCSNSFSGPLAFTGEQETKYGMDLYFRVVNDAGGVHGRTIRTIYYDDGYRREDAVSNTRKLVEQDRVFAIVGPQGPPPVVATLEYLEQNKVPLLFPFQSSTVTRHRAYVFSGLVLSDRQTRMMIDYLVGQRGYRKFAAIYQDDEYGKMFLAGFGVELARYGLKMGATEPVKRGATDVSAQIAKLRATAPEVTFLVLTPAPATQALKERQKIGWTDTLMVSTGPLTDERYLALAAEAAEGVEGLAVLPDPVSGSEPGVRLYREQMQKYFAKNEPNRYSLSGYVFAMLLVEGAKRAGRNLTREALVKALEGTKDFETGIVPPITIGPDHDTQKQGLWVRLERGHFRQLTDWLRSE